MSSKKYRVEHNGNFLGHHQGKDFQTVVNKAVYKYWNYCNIDDNKPFTLTRGQKTYTVDINGQEC